MKTTNEKLTTLLKIAGDQLRTIEACHKAIRQELDHTPARTPARKIRKYRVQPYHQKLLDELCRGFQAVPTLAGNLNISKASVYQYLSELRRAGVRVEVKNVGNRAGKYRKIFRVVDRAA